MGIYKTRNKGLMTIPSYRETIGSLDPIAHIYKGLEDRDSKAEPKPSPPAIRGTGTRNWCRCNPARR